MKRKHLVAAALAAAATGAMAQSTPVGLWHSIDDKTDPYHYWTTYVKFGIGRATYDAAQEIRNHHITREEGVALVRRYDHEVPRKYLREFLAYLSMEEAEFFEIADRFRSPHLWKQAGGEWRLRHLVS